MRLVEVRKLVLTLIDKKLVHFNSSIHIFIDTMSTVGGFVTVDTAWPLNFNNQPLL